MDPSKHGRLWLATHPVVTTFRWRPNETIGASYSFAIACVLGYLLMTFALWFLMGRRTRPVPTGRFPVFHNVVLSVGSLVMFVGCLQSTVVEVDESRWLWGSKSAWEWLFCFPPGTVSAGRVFFWSYVYYLSKYYEFLDTVILLLRKRPLTFLHVYHHSGAIFMTFFWLEYAMSLQIVGLLFNTTVHVVMYTYFFLCSIGRRPAWKKFLTNMQIVQFVLSFVASVGTLWIHFTGEGCAGMTSGWFSLVFTASLLVLFLNFYRRQYGNRDKSQATTKSKGL